MNDRQKTIAQFEGGTYDHLSQESRYVTALHWERHPWPSMADLIEKISLISPEIGEIIEDDGGISYFILSEGDRCPYSGWTANQITCQTGEWDADLSVDKRRQIDDILEDEAIASQITDILTSFEEAVIEEVEGMLSGISNSDIPD